MATSLKDVQLSQSGETKVEPKKEESFSFPTDLQPETKSTGAYNVIFKLVKKKKGRTHIDGICNNVLNPKTNKRERIWLLNGADSIWNTELTETLKDKAQLNKSRFSLIFEDGVCRISSNDELTLQFARLNKSNVGKNRNGSGKFDYYEYNANEEQKDRLAKQMTKIQTVLKISEMQIEPMKKLASFLGIVFFDEMGQVKGEDGIRSELLLKADSQPETVNKYIGSKEVEVAYMVKKAIIEAKIDLTGQQGNAIWAGGKGFIGKIPATRKAYEYLTELAMTNSNEGRAFKEQLETMIT